MKDLENHCFCWSLKLLWIAEAKGQRRKAGCKEGGENKDALEFIRPAGSRLLLPPVSMLRSFVEESSDFFTRAAHASGPGLGEAERETHGVGVGWKSYRLREAFVNGKSEKQGQV